MIKTFVKKPVAVQAIQWNGYNFQEIVDFVGIHNLRIQGNLNSPDLIIYTLEGDHHGIEFIPGPCDVHCIVRDYDGRRYVSKRISSYDGLSLIGLDPEAHIFKVVDDAIDELEAAVNEVTK